MTQVMPTDQETLKADETHSLVSASKVQGTNLYNGAGEDLGKIEDVMLDKATGKVAYAVVTFGGFLGMGKERRALPWSVLHYDQGRDAYVADATDDILRGTPELGDYTDRAWGTRLHQHFGAPPYWN